MEEKTARPLWQNILILTGAYLAAQVVFALLAGLFAGEDTILAVVVATVLTYAAVIPFGVWLLRGRATAGGLLPFRLRGASAPTILFGFLMMLVINVVLEPLLTLFPDAGMNRIDEIIRQGGGPAMLLTVVLAPVCEEMFFRGVVQGGVAREAGAARAILLSAAVFGIIHLVPQQVVAGFFCGVVLGYIYYRTRTLVPVIAIHMLNNAAAYITTRMLPAGATLRSEMGNDTWYWIVYAVCALTLVASLVGLWRELKKLPREL
jgi:membrane protease YdiL (CAAX protease family)